MHPVLNLMCLGIIMKVTSKIVIIVSLVFAMSACSTVAGFGKDLKKGGHAIEKAAKKASN
jgi:predicted small secreted protein